MKSDNVKKGMQQAPHRSLFNALGFHKRKFKNRWVGFYSDINKIWQVKWILKKI